MAQEYTVNYKINVEATSASQEIHTFAENIKKLNAFNIDTKPVIANINNLVSGIDNIFKSRKAGAKNPTYSLTINTKSSERNLERVKNSLNGIKGIVSSINLQLFLAKEVSGQLTQSQAKRTIKSYLPKIDKKTAKANVDSIQEAQRRITKSVGKVNSALISLEQGRKLKIKTDDATKKLNTVLDLLKRIKTTATSTMGLRIASGGIMPGKNGSLLATSNGMFVMSDKANQKLREKLHANRLLNNQKLEQKRKEQEQAFRIKQQYEASKRFQKEQDQQRREQETTQQRQARDAKRQQQRNIASSVKGSIQKIRNNNKAYEDQRKSAINRLQYSKTPSISSLPVIGGMMNAYMAYSFMKRELNEAVEYANIMESARSILKVSDGDLGTFENRFIKMAQNVRKVGIETKFTTLEVAGAVKFLAMAGQNIDSINQSIRPIANLALIGDNDLAQIADLTTNIMAGYDIKSNNMDSVADIMASTISQANVNIIELAESFKMAAGYLQMAGVEFTEASAAIGILGNMGIKGTMAGSALRAMSTRFAKPTKQSQQVLDRLGIKFTYMKDIEGKQVETLKPLADIFEELNRKNASMADMQIIFGKIGGNAAMMLLKNYDDLRQLTASNKTSNGISGELANVKQNTTKGLWYQVTSLVSESFMRGYEVLEPQVRKILNDLLTKFKAPEMAKGFAALGRALLDIFSLLAKIGTWFVNNFHWIEPLLFTGIVATRLFKLAGALTNIGVAIGFIGKQSAATSSIQFIQNLTGMNNGLRGFGGLGKLSVADKREIIIGLKAAGISGKGAYTKALTGKGIPFLASNLGLFASQVSTGNGLLGAGASLSSLGAGALAAAGAVSILAGVIGYAAYKTWKVKEAKDAVLEDINSNKKYRYKSIEDLYSSLRQTREEAERTKKAVENIGNKTIVEKSGHTIGFFTSNWWNSLFSYMPSSSGSTYGGVQSHSTASPNNSFVNGRQKDIREALLTIAKIDGQERVNAAWAVLGKLSTAIEIDAFMKTIETRWGQGDDLLNPKLFTKDSSGNITYDEKIGEMSESAAAGTPVYQQYMNNEVVKSIKGSAASYKRAITNYSEAKNLMEEAGFNFELLEKAGYKINANNKWVYIPLANGASKEAVTNRLANKSIAHEKLIQISGRLRSKLGGQGSAAANVMRAAGISDDLFMNEPESKGSPYNTNPITNDHLSGYDDGGAGGNYSGTGKLSSATPKQVIVNISNLLSIETIKLLRSQEGKSEEIQNVKEQLAQALIDVVHDFDASWNG